MIKFVDFKSDNIKSDNIKPDGEFLANFDVRSFRIKKKVLKSARPLS